MNEVLTDEAMVALIIGFFSPPILSVIIQTRWSRAKQAIAAFVWSLLVGGLTAYFAGDLTGRSLVSAILVVLVATITFYKGFWKPTGISPVIEYHTSGRPYADPH